MRRITLTVVTTLAILVLLFSYRTSRNQSVTAATVSVASAHVVSGPTTAATASAAGPDPTTNKITIPSPSASSSSTATVTVTKSSTAAAATASKSSVAATTTAKSAATTKVDGSVVSTQYGDVQVEVTITNGKITDVQAIQYPNQDPRDQQINSDALPQLQAQVLAAQSANIAGVGGATYTTEGYVTSLQSALDAANFK